MRTDRARRARPRRRRGAPRGRRCSSTSASPSSRTRTSGRSPCCARRPRSAPRGARRRARRGHVAQGRHRVQRAVRRVAARPSSTSARSSRRRARGPGTGSSARRCCSRCWCRPTWAPRTSRSCGAASTASRASDVTGMFSGLRRFRKGVLRNVTLHSVLERKVTTASETVKSDLEVVGLLDRAGQGHDEEPAQARAGPRGGQAGVGRRRRPLGLVRLPRHVLVQRRRRHGQAGLRAGRAGRGRAAASCSTWAPTTASTRCSRPSTPSTSWPSTATRRSSTCCTAACGPRATRRSCRWS